MEQSVDLTMRAGSTGHHLAREVVELFCLAQILTGDDEAAIALVMKAMDSQTAVRRTVIEAACDLLSPEIKSAAQRVYDGSSFHDGLTAGSLGVALNFETLRSALLEMNLLIRLVWVLRLAEGYSTMETAKLLHVEPWLVGKALAAAMIRLASIFQSQS